MMAVLVLVLFVVLVILLRKNMHRLLRKGRRKLLLSIYMSLLLLASLVYFILQTQIEPLAQHAAAPLSMMDLLYEMETADDLEAYRVEEWEVELKEGQIKLVSEGGQHFLDYLPVFIIESEAEGDRARLGWYQTPTLVDGINLTDRIDLPEIQVEKGVVTVSFTPQVTAYEFHSLQSSFVSKQFSTETTANERYLQVSEFAIILELPKGTAVLSDLDQFELLQP